MTGGERAKASPGLAFRSRPERPHPFERDLRSIDAPRRGWRPSTPLARGAVGRPVGSRSSSGKRRRPVGWRDRQRRAVADQPLVAAVGSSLTVIRPRRPTDTHEPSSPAPAFASGLGAPHIDRSRASACECDRRRPRSPRDRSSVHSGLPQTKGDERLDDERTHTRPDGPGHGPLA